MTRDLPMEDDDPGAGDHADDLAYRAATGVARVARAGAYVTGGALIASNGSPAPTNESHTSHITGWVSNDPQPDAPNPVITYPDPGPDSAPPPVPATATPEPVAPKYWTPPQDGGVPAPQFGTLGGSPGVWTGTDSPAPTADFDEYLPGGSESFIPAPAPSTGTHGLESTQVPAHGYSGTSPFGLPGTDGSEFGLPGSDQGFDLPGYLMHPTQAPVADSMSPGSGFSSFGASPFDDADPSARMFGMPGADSATPSDQGFGPSEGYGVGPSAGSHPPGADGLGTSGFGAPDTGDAFDGIGDGGMMGVYFHTESTLDVHVGLDGIWATTSTEVDVVVGDVAVGDLGQQLDRYGDLLGGGTGSAAADPAAPGGDHPMLSGLGGQAPHAAVPGAQPAEAGGPAGAQSAPAATTGSAVVGQGAPTAGPVPVAGAAPGAAPTPGAAPAGASPAPMAAATPAPMAAPAAMAPAPMAPAPAPFAPPAPVPNISVAQPFSAAPAPIAAAPPPPPPPAPAPMIAQPVAVTPWQTTIQPEAASHPIANVLVAHPGPSPLTAPAAAVPALFERGPSYGPETGGAGPSQDGESSTSVTHSPTGSSTPSSTPHGGAGTTTGGTTKPSHTTDPDRPGVLPFGPGSSTTVTPSHDSGTTRPDTSRPETTRPGTSTETRDPDDATVTPTVTPPRESDSDNPAGGAHRPTTSDQDSRPSDGGPSHDGPSRVPTRDAPSQESTGAEPTSIPSHAPTVPSISRPVQPDRDGTDTGNGTGNGPATHTQPTQPHTTVNPPTTADQLPDSSHPVRPVAYQPDSYDDAHTGLSAGMHHGLITADGDALSGRADGGALSGNLLPDPAHGDPHQPVLHLVADPHFLL
ncbi:hypothetical protein [Nocardia sp. BMG51109]|uniref:hypothetical protein n=1 Tax=Nocardia sp. BMG51109 TaxID=1056816 RepID=UPI000685AE87|nr:hypothetical protein [Nocardia sp. BMG51109]